MLYMFTRRCRIQFIGYLFRRSDFPLHGRVSVHNFFTCEYLLHIRCSTVRANDHRWRQLRVYYNESLICNNDCNTQTRQRSKHPAQNVVLQTRADCSAL